MPYTKGINPERINEANGPRPCTIADVGAGLVPALGLGNPEGRPYAETKKS